jgi:hypothetical protein
MSGGEHSSRYPPLHCDRELEQPDGVGDNRAATSDPRRQLVVRHPEVLQQLLVGGSFLERIELHPVDVFQQRVAQHCIVCSAPNYRWDAVQSGQLRRPPPPLTHD